MSGITLLSQQHVGSNTLERVCKNSAEFDRNDPVTIDSNGFLAPAAAGEKIVGIWAENDYTAAADNQTVARVKGKFYPITPDMVFSATADQACVDTDCGAYADLAVSAGAYTVNLSAGASGQCFIIDFDPVVTTTVYFNIAERSQDAYAQA